MSPHISPAALQKMRQARFLDCKQFVIGEERKTYTSYWAEQTSEISYLLTDSQRMGNIDMFGPTALRAGITPVVVTSASVHSLSQNFSLLGEAEGSDPGWHMEWTGRHDMLPIARLRDPQPMSSSYDAKELWHLTHGMRRLALTESPRDAQRLLELTYENATLGKHLNSDLHLRRGRDVRVVSLPPGGGTRMRQCGYGLQTSGGGTSRRGWGTGDDSV
ncbi:hypothetical protein GIB67_006966 [Kingdonia uniflora]|uniref:Uncharacterized protein n=1 Tax=Kingdonia uniflora TaxID=39325 RepID=A0A7J7NZD4_9MAGN|nr:hypothetical protein GIB67_006966 [Kingdonia uniflora]